MENKSIKIHKVKFNLRELTSSTDTKSFVVYYMGAERGWKRGSAQRLLCKLPRSDGG